MQQHTKQGRLRPPPAPSFSHLAKELVPAQTAKPRDPGHFLGAAHFPAAEETRGETVPLLRVSRGAAKLFGEYRRREAAARPGSYP